MNLQYSVMDNYMQFYIADIYIFAINKNSCTNGMLISMYQKIFSLSTGFEMMNNRDIYTHDI